MPRSPRRAAVLGVLALLEESQHWMEPVVQEETGVAVLVAVTVTVVVTGVLVVGVAHGVATARMGSARSAVSLEILQIIVK